MSVSASTKSKKPPAPHEWVFRWQGSTSSIFPKLFATVIVGGAFLFLITTLKIQLTVRGKPTGHKASVIFPADDAEGRALALRAREGGPFPSRFEPSQWPGLANIEAKAMDEAAFRPPAHAMELRDLPEQNRITKPPLAEKGTAFFPKRKPVETAAPDVGKVKPEPTIYALSGITAAGLPHALPAFTAPVDSAMSSASWRFVARLNATGFVTECVSLEKGSEPGAAEIETWLRSVPFAADPAKPSRWIAIGVSFTNQPDDGTEPN